MLFVPILINSFHCLMTLQPPQVLASILHQFEELSLELWPKHTEALVQDVESGNRNWQNGMDGVESL